jgi:AcrR family transcriptional regulator
MRVRTEEKRQEIIRIAAELFDDLGYERTSMSAIAAKVGGSKATLYGYFQSKEDLLRAVLDRDVNEEADHLLQEFLSEKDLRSALVRLGISYLSRHHSRAASIRTVANQPIAQEFYETVLRPAWQRLADRFATMMKEGRLKFADPWTTAMHWKGLNEWDMLERHLLSANAASGPNEIVTAATAAADAFLKVYASPAESGEMAL